MKRKLFLSISGLLIGLINGFLGAGGGLLAVPLLKRLGCDTKTAHRCAVAVILPMTALSAVLYIMEGRVTLSQGLVFVPWGLIGAAAGTLCLKKISSKWLTAAFGGFMIYAGVRLLMR